MSTKGRLATSLVVLAAVVRMTIGSTAAPTAAADVGGWGTFAHIATTELASADARDAVVQRYDVLFLRGDLTPALLADLRARRPGILLYAYEKAAGLNATETDAFDSDHPDWLARDADGDTIEPKSIPETTLADLTNADFRAWQAGKIADEVALGADGAYIDTLGAYFPDGFYTGRPVIDGVAVTDAAWRDGSIALVTRIRELTGKPVVANGFGIQSGKNYSAHKADADPLIAAADGIQIEHFTRNGNTPVAQYQTASAWDQDLAFLEMLGTQGKLTFAYTKVKGSASNSELVRLHDYGLGSFLLGVVSPHSYFGFGDGDGVFEVESDASWARGLGAPTSGRTRSGTDGWQRVFSSGVLTQRVGGAPVVSSTSGSPTTTTTQATTTTTQATTSTTQATTSTTQATTSTTIATRRIATFTGSGSMTFSLKVGSGLVTATLTFGEGERKLGIYREGDPAAGPVTGASPVIVGGDLPGRTYGFRVRGPGSGPFTLRVDYPVPTAAVVSTHPDSAIPTALLAALALAVIAFLPPLRRRGAHF